MGGEGNQKHNLKQENTTNTPNRAAKIKRLMTSVRENVEQWELTNLL